MAPTAEVQDTHMLLALYHKPPEAPLNILFFHHHESSSGVILTCITS